MSKEKCEFIEKLCGVFCNTSDCPKEQITDLKQQLQTYKEENKALPKRVEELSIELGETAELLRQAKEENEKLNYIIDKQEKQLATEMQIILKLTHQNKQMREALEKIETQKIDFSFDGLCNLKLDSCTNDCKSCFQNIAKQALGE